MSESLIGDEGLIELSQIIYNSKKQTCGLIGLKHIFLKRNMITGVGCKKFFISLLSNKTIRLKTIDLSMNEITDDGACFIFKKLYETDINNNLISIQNLVLCNNKINNSDIKKSCIKDMCLAMKFKKLNNWQTLQLSNNKIGNRACEVLFNSMASYQFKLLFKINMSDCDIDDMSIQALGKCFDNKCLKQLIHLDISFNNITSVGMKTLISSINIKNVNQLLYFNIGGNQIGDIGINMLTSSLLLGDMKYLTNLDISCNQGVNCVSNLANAILKGSCPNLQELNIMGNFPPHFKATELFKNKVRVKIC